MFHDFLLEKTSQSLRCRKPSCFYTGKMVSSQRIYTKIAPKPDVFDVLKGKSGKKDLHPQSFSSRGKNPERKWWLEDDPFLLGGRSLFKGYVKLGGVSGWSLSGYDAICTSLLWTSCHSR